MITVFTPQIVSALESDPILINSCDDLNAISSDAESLAGDYKLNVDIDCATTADDNENSDEWQGGTVGGTLIPDSYTGVINNGYSGFDPIGGPQDPFTGTFDGNGKVISNLWIFRKDTSHVGLFGFTLDASIHDLALASSSIVGQQYTGGLVGYASDTSIARVTVNDSMTRAYLSYHGGGLVGSMNTSQDPEYPAVITESTVTGGTVHGSGNIIGGLVGSMNGGVLAGSTTSADVDGGFSIGGAIGELNDGLVNLVTVGEATVHADYRENVQVGGIAKSGNNAGGLVGYMSGGTIKDPSGPASVTVGVPNTGIQ
jgi:hypothetical protein